MTSNIPITNGQGQSSVAAEEIGTIKYQKIKVVGGETGSTSVWGITPDGSAKVSIIGIPNVNVSGSVFATLSGAGSIISIPTGSIITVFQSSSILAVPVSSTITVWQSPSIVGTQQLGAAFNTTKPGLLVFGLRNDTLSSVVSGDQLYAPNTIGPVGETITANAPLTKWVRGTADLRVVLGSSVTAIAAQGASIFTYITGVQVANFGPSSVIVTFGGGLGSILGYTIAPAGGGSNIIYTNALKTGENSAFTASINGTASVLVSAQGFIAKI